MSELNPDTRRLLRLYPAKGLLCIANGVLAATYTIVHYESHSHIRGNGDAFRHVLWNFGMAIDVGIPFARRWSSAHEFGFPNNRGKDMDMDMFNNNQGLLLAARYPNTLFHTAFIWRSIALVDREDARRIVGRTIEYSSRFGRRF